MSSSRSQSRLIARSNMHRTFVDCGPQWLTETRSQCRQKTVSLFCINMNVLWSEKQNSVSPYSVPFLPLPPSHVLRFLGVRLGFNYWFPLRCSSRHVAYRLGSAPCRGLLDWRLAAPFSRRRIATSARQLIKGSI